jgi:hypothetical protein
MKKQLIIFALGFILAIVIYESFLAAYIDLRIVRDGYVNVCKGKAENSSYAVALACKKHAQLTRGTTNLTQLAQHHHERKTDE